MYNFKMRKSMFYLIVMVCWYLGLAYDTTTNYLTTEATAMAIHQSSTSIVFADINHNIYHQNIQTKANITSFASSHKAKISSLAISPDGTLVLSGSYDFTAQLRNLGTGALICKWYEIRGKVTGTTILSDNIMAVFTSQSGQIFYSNDHINCTVTLATFINKTFTSVASMSSGTQVFITDLTSSVVNKFDISTSINTLLTVGSTGMMSAMSVGTTSYVGVCSKDAFYLINTTGNIQFTLNFPSATNYKCRIHVQSATEYYLTALTQTQSIEINGGNYELLWKIYRITIGAGPTFSSYMVREQQNVGNRYGNPSIQPLDAGFISMSSSQIYVASIGEGYNPFQNVFGDNGSSSCDTGTYDAGSCALCVSQASTQGCSRCSNSGQCQSCYNGFYLQNPAKICTVCPTNCYACSSNTNCDGCQAGYYINGNSCDACNIDGCVNCQDQGGRLRCYECEIGFYTTYNKDCMECQSRFPGCLICDYNRCYECDTEYILFNATTGICEKCSHYMDGCVSCLNQTYCQACQTSYPYFDTGTTTRGCKDACATICLTCNRNNYDQCTSCGTNKVLSGTTCTCANTGSILNATSLNCQLCSLYLSNCANCTNYNYCTTCQTGYYFDTTNSSHRQCATCNYTCATCSTEWNQCATCSAAHNRTLNGTLCVCTNNSYFQYGNQTGCQLCYDHLTNCPICHNETFCLTCDSGYFIDSISTGNNQCTACTLPCVQCFGTATNCTDCVAGRQLSGNACVCLAGEYSTGVTTCANCSDVLGACTSCTNGTVCLACWSNNYFQINGSKTICASCQSSCLTCNTWTTVCATCDPTAKRVLNATTNQCDCMTGYTLTSGSCLNCQATFTYCTSCNATHCLSCQVGYSLAFGGLKCIQCNITYPGCTLCLNGVCAACNATENYDLSYSMCICKDGYYLNNSQCVPYAMGSTIKRSFPSFAYYSQPVLSSVISIRIYFVCQGLKFPYGVPNSVYLIINNQNISYDHQIIDNVLVLNYTPTQSLSRASIRVQLVEDRVYDEDEYQPNQLQHLFSKNIYHQSQSYDVALRMKQVYQNYIIDVVRWLFTVLVLLGCVDELMSLIFVTHVLPSFIFLTLSLPPPLSHVLQSMITIHKQSLFAIPSLNIDFQPYTTLTLQNYGIDLSIVQSKLLDIILLGGVFLFYGVIGPYLLKFIPNGKLSKLWEYKFILKKYSTVSLTILCYGPILMVSALVNYHMQVHNPNQIISLGLSVLLVGFFCMMLCVHSLILYSTQQNEDYNNEDCYMGTSPQEPKSILYIISYLLIFMMIIPLLLLLPGYFCLPVFVLLLLWNIFYFKSWSMFQSKILFFIRLFSEVLVLAFVVAMLMFYISQNYSPVDIATLQIFGLFLIIDLIILLILSTLELLYLFVWGIVVICRVRSSAVQQLMQVNNYSRDENEFPHQQSRPTTVSTHKKKPNLNKKEHLKKFQKEELYRTTNLEKRSQ